MMLNNKKLFYPINYLRFERNVRSKKKKLRKKKKGQDRIYEATNSRFRGRIHALQLFNQVEKVRNRCGT